MIQNDEVWGDVTNLPKETKPGTPDFLGMKTDIDCLYRELRDTTSSLHAMLDSFDNLRTEINKWEKQTNEKIQRSSIHTPSMANGGR